MSTNPYALVPPKRGGAQLDRASGQAMVRSANRIATVGNIARAALDEMSTNYITAEQLASQALTAAHCMASKAPQTPVSQAFLHTLTQQYLQHMVRMVHIANDTIIRRASSHDIYDK